MIERKQGARGRAGKLGRALGAVALALMAARAEAFAGGGPLTRALIPGGGGAGGILPPPTTSTTTTTLPLSGGFSGTASAPVCTMTCPAADSADFNRLSMVVEVHVENRLLGTEEETDLVFRIAEAANAAGVRISFGFGVDFLDDYAAGVDSLTGRTLSMDLASVVSALKVDCCHDVSLHADVPETTAGADVATYLTPYLSELSGAGADATVASGVCNEAGGSTGWVKGARDAGLKTVAGVVAYCQGSLRSSDPYWVDPSTCSPGSAHCTQVNGDVVNGHDTTPLDNPSQRVATWRTRKTQRWLTPVTRRPSSADLVILGGMGEANFPCLGEFAAGSTSCPTSGYTGATPSAADASAFVDIVEEAQASYRSGGTGDVVYVTFSTNAAPDEAWLQAMFADIAAEIDARGLAPATQWSTLPAVGAVNRVP